MDRNTSSSPSEVFVSISSSDCPIRALNPIVPLREALENEGGILNDIPSIFSNHDVDHLHNTYHISRKSFWIFAPSLHIHANDLIPASDTIIVFEEQLKADLRFPLYSFFLKVLKFHKFSVA